MMVVVARQEILAEGTSEHFARLFGLNGLPKSLAKMIASCEIYSRFIHRCAQKST